MECSLTSELAAMDSLSFERIAELRDSGRLEDAIRESKVLLAKSTDTNEKASLLGGALVFCCTLGRLTEARQLLDQLKQLQIPDLEVRLNAEFCEPCLLIREGNQKEGVSAFATMLQRYSETFKEARFRYLYEDIQCRQALALVGLGRFAEAIPILKEATSFAFNSAVDAQQAHFALGICYDKAKAADSAKEEFLRVINFGLRNDLEERARYSLAIICFNAGAFAQAKQQLEMILQSHPDEPPAVSRKYVYEQLAHIYRHLGDKTNAKLWMDLARK
jgi:tetratricopeptide (TPR) repeat protein